jgi:hypothetical protein
MYSPGKTIRFLFYYIFADWERGYYFGFFGSKKSSKSFYGFTALQNQRFPMRFGYTTVILTKWDDHYHL